MVCHYYYSHCFNFHIHNQLHNLDYSFKVMLTFMYRLPSGIYSTRYLSSHVSISLYHTSTNQFLPIMLDLPPEILLATAFRIRDAVQKNIESIYRLYPELIPIQPVDPSEVARAQEAALASVALSKFRSAGPDLVSTTQSIRSSDEVEAALALVALSQSAGPDLVSTTQSIRSSDEVEAALALVALSQSTGLDIVSPTQLADSSELARMQEAALALVALSQSASLDIVSPTQLADSSELARMREAALALVALSQSAGPDVVSPTQPVEPSDEVKAALALVALKFSQPNQRTVDTYDSN